MMKTIRAQLKALRQELRYHQTMVRVDLRAARAGMEKCRAIGKQMRMLQKENADHGPAKQKNKRSIK